MKAPSSTRTVIAILVVVAMAIVFWMLFVGPKREQSERLNVQAEQLQANLAQAESTVATGEEARTEFPTNYQQLVVLGKAVPAGDESASLLIQLNHIAEQARVKFESLKVGTAEGSENTEAATAEPAPTPESEAAESSTGVPAAAVAPTEAAASLEPIGAIVGPAGLSILPYDLTFNGSFFHVADFIKGIDSLVSTSGQEIAVDGRLVTLDGFALSGDPEKGFPDLNANFSVTTYLVPPDQGITAGATQTEPGEVESLEPAAVSNLR